jgi:hypothetical protein
MNNKNWDPFHEEINPFDEAVPEQSHRINNHGIASMFIPLDLELEEMDLNETKCSSREVVVSHNMMDSPVDKSKHFTQFQASMKNYSNEVWPKVVQFKLNRSLYYNSVIPEELIPEYAKILCNPALILDRYLNFDKYIHCKRNNEASSQNNNNNNNNSGNNNRNRNSEDLPQMELRLVVFDELRSKTKKVMRKIKGRMGRGLSNVQTVDYFPEALSIGPWLIELNTASICVPRRNMTSNAIFCAEFATVFGEANIRQMLAKVAEFIAYENANIEYTAKIGDLTSTQNSHQFVDLLLGHLGMQLDFEKRSPIDTFLTKLNEKGLASVSIRLSEKFKHKFGKQSVKDKIWFKTHRDLDKFVDNLLNIDPDLELNHAGEYYLLKAFDRAMWMNYKKYSEIPPAKRGIKEKEFLEQYEPFTSRGHGNDCPFGNPDFWM